MGAMTKLFLLSIFILSLSYFFYQKSPETPVLKTLPYELSGSPDSQATLVFLHGWPNTFRMWDKMIENLKKDYFIINISYPNLAKGVNMEWGLDQEELAHLIHKTVLEIEAKLQPGKTSHKRLFVAHDWGSILAYILDTHYGGFIQSLVSLDVGGEIENTIKAKLSMAAYQWYLTANFLIGGHIGKIGTKFFFDHCMKAYGLSEEDHSRLDSSWNYFYYYFCYY